MLFLRTFWMDIRRILSQKKTWMSLLFAVAVIVFTSSHLIGLGSVDVLTLCCTGMQESASFLMITAVLPIFVYSACVAEDRKNNSLLYFASRSGVIRYAISKYLAALLSSMLLFAAAMLITALIFSCFFPFCTEAYQNGNGYFYLIEAGKPVSYFAMFLLHYMLSAACFSATCFLAASCFQESFVAYTLPVMVYFFLQRIGSNWQIPYWLRPGGLIQSIYDLDSILPRALVILAYCLLCGILSVYRIRRRSYRS